MSLTVCLTTVREDKERLTIVDPRSIGRQLAVQHVVLVSRCVFPSAIKGASHQPSSVPKTLTIHSVDEKAAAFLSSAMALK